MQSIHPDDFDQNLRLFAIRKAAAASKEFSELSSRVVVSIQSNTNSNCPMHGKHGSFQQNGPHQLPQPQQQQQHFQTEHQQHISRKEFCKELRLLSSRPSSEATPRRSNSLAVERSFSRSQSMEPSAPYQSNSMPRRLSSTAATKNASVFRKGSFQDPPKPVIREKYTGRVDFKSILRKFDPKEEERSSGGRYDGEPRDYHRDSQFQQHMLTQNPYASPRRGATAIHTSELDFDFRSGASPVPRNGTSSASVSVRSLSPRRPQDLELDLNNLRRRGGQEQLRSPEGTRRAESNPHSPRRVEFADQVLFTFSQEDLNRQFQRNTVGPSKPILRQSRSDQEQQQQARPLTLLQQFELNQQQQQQQQQHYQPQYNYNHGSNYNKNNNNNLKTTIIPLVIEHANLDKNATTSVQDNDPVNQRKVSNGDSLVQIYVPPDDDGSLYHSSADEEEETETLSAGSRDEHRADDFLPDDEPVASKPSKSKLGLGLNFLRTLSFEPPPEKEKEEDKKRKVPPPLGDWSRSQSFPPPGKTFGVAGESSTSRPEEDSGHGSSVFGGRPLSKGMSSVSSSVSCNSDIEGKDQLKRATKSC